MRINFFERKLIPNRISIEKVFSIIKFELQKKGVLVKSFENPYLLKNMIKALFFFKKNQGEINHITGDIHWACFLLNPSKTVLTIHDIVGAHSYRSIWKTRLYLLIWLYLPIYKLKYITVISQKTKDEILKYYPSASAKIRVINNPSTTGIFHREINQKETDDITILLVGTRINKNIERVLEATAKMKCQIIIIGEQSELQEKLIQKSEAKILSYNFVTDEALEAFYRKADILCFPSLYEGFGMPIIEAQSAGCAVITSALEPMTSVAGSAAVFVDPLDTEDIKLKIETLIGDWRLRRDLVKMGYENVKHFLPDAIAQQYIELYQEMAGEKRSSSNKSVKVERN